MTFLSVTNYDFSISEKHQTISLVGIGKALSYLLSRFLNIVSRRPIAISIFVVSPLLPGHVAAFQAGNCPKGDSGPLTGSFRTYMIVNHD